MNGLILLFTYSLGRNSLLLNFSIRFQRIRSIAIQDNQLQELELLLESLTRALFAFL